MNPKNTSDVTFGTFMFSEKQLRQNMERGTNTKRPEDISAFTVHNTSAGPVAVTFFYGTQNKEQKPEDAVVVGHESDDGRRIGFVTVKEAQENGIMCQEAATDYVQKKFSAPSAT